VSVKEVSLSPGQAEAISRIKDWYEETDSQVFRMWGPAGTGKTTIARLVPEALGLSRYDFAAFSGKAAQVLRSKGCTPASTLHSLVYGAPINLQTDVTKLERQAELLETTLNTGRMPGMADNVSLSSEQLTDVRQRLASVVAEIAALKSQIRRNGPFLWPKKEDSPLVETGILIADEVSMVNERMAHDILDFGVRVLVLGDPEQLPPVGGEGYFTSQQPDVMLSEVHRQALDSPVLALATRVRLGGAVTTEEYASANRTDYTTFDQILCWRRATRWGAINYLRKELGRPAGVPVPGDKVMNLANNKDMGVFNGQTFWVIGVEPGRNEDEYLFTLCGEGDDQADSSSYVQMFGFAYGFTQEGEQQAEKQRLGWRGDTALLTFAQALTVHKAQGSEWGDVCLLDESRAMWAMESRRSGYLAADTLARRWLYTGITRAAERITLIVR
jgi:exodeoxyribonuclease-5